MVQGARASCFSSGSSPYAPPHPPSTVVRLSVSCTEGQGGKGLGTDPLGSVAWALSQPWISYPFALDLVFPSLKWGNDS